MSVLVWEDGGDEELAIAALLLEATAAAGESHRSIGERFGERVADLVLACRSFVSLAAAEAAIPAAPDWVETCRAKLQTLPGQPLAVLRLITAQVAQEAWEVWQCCRRNRTLWEQQPGGLEGAAWYWLRLHQLLRHGVPGSLAIERLAGVLQRLLASPLYGERIPVGLAPSVWAARYDDRCLLTEPLPDLPLPPPAARRSASQRPAVTSTDRWPAPPASDPAGWVEPC